MNLRGQESARFKLLYSAAASIVSTPLRRCAYVEKAFAAEQSDRQTGFVVEEVVLHMFSYQTCFPSRGHLLDKQRSNN